MAAKPEDRLRAGASNVPTRGHEPLQAGDVARERAAMADTLPPTPLKDLLSSGGANLFVLSTDSELIDTVQRAGGEQYPVLAVERWEDLEVAIESGRCGIALLDAELLGHELVRRIAALDAYSSRLVTLVASDRSVAQQLMGLLSDRKIHRLLIKPPALGITRLLIESAVNRCLQLRHPATADGGVGEVRQNASAARRKTGVAIWVVASAAVALLVGVGLVVAVSEWWGADSATEAEPTVVAAAAVPAARVDSAEQAEAAPQRFAELLSKAERAFREGRLAAPTGDNALDYYLTILAADPTQETAHDQLGLVVDALFANAEAALLANSLDTAATALASVRRADPTSSRLAFLEAQLERSRADEAARAAAPPVVAVPSRAAAAETSGPAVAESQRTELDSLLTIATARLERGQLLEPVGDSAREYVDRAAQLQPNDSRVAVVRAELAAALVTAARVRLENAELEAAAALVDEARRFGAARGALALLEADLSTARAASVQRRYAELLLLAQSRLRSGALLTPPDDNAWHYLAELQREAPDFFGLAASWEEFVSAVSGNVRRALAARDWSAADAQLAVLRQVPNGSTAVAPLLEELEAGRLQEQYLAAAAPASELNLLSVVPAVYPREAQQRGVEGWVELEFVVDRSGRPKDLVVIAAQPEGRFESAALEAVGQYRYVPFERNARVYERRVRLRVRFTLE